MPQEVDRERVAKLAVEIMLAVRRTITIPPLDRDSVYIPLNALAFAVATILAGTGNDPAARGFFDDALSQNIVLLLKEE
jgi:hypothetical protein